MNLPVIVLLLALFLAFLVGAVVTWLNIEARDDAQRVKDLREERTGD